MIVLDEYRAELKKDVHWFEDRILKRFLRYVAFPTTSNRQATEIPSTPGQRVFAEALAAELRSLGISQVEVDDHSYVYSCLPASEGLSRKVPPLGLVAHLDTASDAPGENVKPRVHEHYDGKPIVLEAGVVLHPQDSPQLLSYKGRTIITSDGTTLLGSDDKAGIAEIITAFEYFTLHPDEPHGKLELVFTPDEETGRGTNEFPRDKLASSFCLTLDGGGDGTIEAECFDAYNVNVTIKGKSIHLGDARGRLVNAVTLLGELLSMLPAAESPEATDGRYGYYAPIEATSTIEEATVSILIRDFEERECLRRVKAIKACAKALETLYPGAVCNVKSEKQYSNMFPYIKKEKRAFALIKEAIQMSGIAPRETIIRGGTDGARLSETGIPTPNLFDGGFNYHSRKEWAALDAMVRACRTVICLAQLWTRD
ncbi:MAG: peptidase T [Spirochaetaceae bacterium]|nr:MAG: peptidase T [Spirochaetaceae bacterium]